jgi:hypothetical protein
METPTRAKEIRKAEVSVNSGYQFGQNLHLPNLYSLVFRFVILIARLHVK